MFSSALGRNVTRGAFENFKQRLLHPFAGNVAGDGDVVGLSPDLVDLVNVNNPDLGAFHIVIGVLQQPQDDVLDIFTDVAGFG